MKKKLLCKKDKKALSAVVTTLLLVLIALAGVALFWTSSRSVIDKQIESSEACYGIEGKVEFNSRGVCYEKNGSNYYVRFQIDVKDIELQKLIISISSNFEQKSYTLTNKTQIIPGLKRYPNEAADLIVPGVNTGFSYRAGPFTGLIDSIEITPVMDDYQCNTADSTSDIENCDLFAS